MFIPIFETLFFMVVLRWWTQIGFVPALLLAFAAACLNAVLILALLPLLGVLSLIPAMLITGGLVGAALSALYGVEIKRAFVIGGSFCVVDMIFRFGYLAAISQR